MKKLIDNEITLKPIRFRDKAEWEAVRAVNRDWLTPWEATRPKIESNSRLPSYYGMVMALNKEIRAVRSISLGIWLRENDSQKLIGQITLGGIIFGAMRGAHIGYWIDQRFASRGYTTRAVKLLTKFAFQTLKLHRIEINLRPENEASKKVAIKAGYVLEGARNNYLHIAGDWRNHITFVKENPEIK
ncbi:MAG: GNAT family N-acetyltransferase [Candidatus Nanopelagicus sp.]